MGHNALCWIYALVVGFEEIIIVGFQFFCWKELHEFRHFVWMIWVTGCGAAVKTQVVLCPVYLGVVCPEPVSS